MKPAPVIICPFSAFDDEIAGNTPDEIALNLAAGTKVALKWRRRPRRKCPDLLAAFSGCKLSPEAKDACRWVQSVYDRETAKAQPQPQELATAS